MVVPTPTALPCTAATSGRVAFPRLLMNLNAWLSPVSLPLAWALKSARSFPAVKLSPSPWNSTTRTAGSFSARSSPSDIALYIAWLSAFFLSARASVNVMMPAAISVFTCSVIIVPFRSDFRYSPFLAKRTKLCEKRPRRAILAIEVPQFLGDRRRLDEELVLCIGHSLAHSGNVDHGVDQHV